jgi:hypothetical protein
MLKGSSGQAQTSSTNQGPWAPQAAALQVGYNQAGTNMQQQLANGPYTGEYVAGNNATQQAADTQASTYAGGAGAGIAAQDASVGSTLTGSAGLYNSNAAAMAANGTPGVNSGVMNNLNSYASGNGMSGVTNMNQGLSSALNSAATTGANAIGGFNSGLSSVAAAATANPTQQLINDATQYSNASDVQSQVANTNSQLQQVLNEQTNPSFNRAAAAGGDLNSSRAGMGEAMNNENEAIAQGNADTSLINNAYNTGMSTAASQNTSGLNTALAANSAGLSGNTALSEGTSNNQLATQLGETNAQTSAGTAALAQQTNSDALNANTQLSANAQLGAGITTGLNANTASGATAANNYLLGSQAGANEQAGQQAADTNAYDQWSGNNTYDSNVLSQYMGAVNGNTGASSTTGTSTPAQSIVSNAAGGAAAGAGLYNMINNSNNNNSNSNGNAPPSTPQNNPGLYDQTF